MQIIPHFFFFVFPLPQPASPIFKEDPIASPRRPVGAPRRPVARRASCRQLSPYSTMFLFDDNLDNIPLESTSLERQGSCLY